MSEDSLVALGIDVGTTYTSAAACSGGQTSLLDVDGRSTTMPSVVLADSGGQVVVGRAALARGATDPVRLAREFKRRIGDPEPVLLAGAPWTPASLTARLIERVLSVATAQLGRPPDRVALTHPARWGPYKTDVMVEAAGIAGVDEPLLLAEPAAAALFYASTRELPSGATIAVYDFGGGTFDTAVVRVDGTSCEVIGRPDGLDRFGGIDIDAAVLSHVRASLGGSLDDLDPTDVGNLAAMRRLRDDCATAKEALSTDLDAVVPVVFPHLTTEVRITRRELDEMVAPVLHDTIVTVHRTLASAGVELDDLHTVLLVGGSSQMPVVSRLVTETLGRPVSIDTHPKHSIASGAALAAAQGFARRTSTVQATGGPATLAAPSGATAATDEQGPVGPQRNTRRGWRWAAAGVVALTVIGGFAATRSNGANDRSTTSDEATSSLAPSTPTEPAVSSRETQTSTATAAPATSPTATSAGVAVSSTATPPTGGTVTASSTVILEAAAGPLTVVFDAVEVDADTGGVVVQWHLTGTAPPELSLEGVGANFHYDTQPSASAGLNAPDFGFFPGIFYNARIPRFSVPPKAGTDDEAATRLCGIVADADYNIIDPSSFACVDLP
ncbi:MAG: Hsp70 family protein [Acidimicrobiales bacterium]